MPIKKSSKTGEVGRANGRDKYVFHGIPEYQDKRIALLKLNNVSKNDDAQELKRVLNRNGLSPVSIKYAKHPITHENLGTGMLVLDLGNTERINRAKQNLERFGFQPEEVPSFNRRAR